MDYFNRAPQEDNSHLDHLDKAIADQMCYWWQSRTGRPRVGDFVLVENGRLRMRRCAHAWDDGMQTSDGGSYYINRNGFASMSGSLYPAQIWEFYKDTGKTMAGRFWMFSHGIPGAGRGVEFYLPCRVYKLEPFAMPEEQARAHPRAKSAAAFWGENERYHREALNSLMKPAALHGGYF